MPIFRADEIKFDDEIEAGAAPAGGIRFDDEAGGQIVSADQIRFDDEAEPSRWSAQQSQPVNMLPDTLDVNVGPDVTGLQDRRSTPVAPGMPTEPPRGGTVATGLKELAEIPVDVARSLPAAGAQTGRSLTGLAEAVTDITGDPGGIVKYAKDYWQRELEATTPEKPSLAFKAGQNIFANVPAMATSIVTGNPALSLTWMGATSAGDRRAELRDKGYSPAAATALSVPHGLAEAIGEKLPLDVLMKPAISYGSRALTATALDILGENVTTALQDGLQKVSDRPDMTLSDFLSDLWETTKVSAVSGPVMAGAAQLTHAAADISTRTDQTIARIQKKLGIPPPEEAGGPPASATPAIGPTGQPEVAGGQIQAPVQSEEEAAAPTVEHRFSAQLRQEYDTLITQGELGKAFDLAYKDNLTGVYNQNGWVRLKSAANEDPDVSVAASDMSGLKYINDTYGHAAGDEVIKAYAESISSKGGMVFRSGKGDELTIIHENSGHLEQLMQAAKEELRKKEFHFQTPSGTIKVKGLDLDYGISHTDKQADEALYAKRAKLEKTGQRNPVRGGKPFGLEETPAAEGPAEQPQPETAEVTPQASQQPATAAPEPQKKYSEMTEKERPLTSYADDDGNFVDADGNTIKKGEKIKFHFAGAPHDMPSPWTLIKAENEFSTVNYRYNPSVTVRAANGVERTYDNAHYYSPIASDTPESPTTKQPQKVAPKLEHNREEVEKSEAKEILGATEVSSKKMKTDLLAGIDKAISTAPDTSEEIKKLNAERQKDIRNDRRTDFVDQQLAEIKRDTVDFEVPGDGTFSVFNDKDALRKFKSLVERNFPAEPISESKPYPTPWGMVKKAKKTAQAVPSRPETPSKQPHWSEKYFKKGEEPGGKTEPTKADTAETKDPWRMTREEYLEANPPKNIGASTRGQAIRDAALNMVMLQKEEEHQDIIRKALSEGKPVPAEVLKDYPDLKPVTPEPTAKAESGERSETSDVLSGLENDIPKSLATRAFEGTSHSPESRGALRIKEYVEAMRSDYEELSGLADTPEKQEYLDNAFPEYRRKYADKIKTYLHAHSNVVSTLVAGPAKFPVERMRKRSDTADRRANEAMEFRKKAFTRMRNEIAPAESRVISSDDPGAVQKLKEKLAALEKRQEHMKAINAAHAKYLKQGDSALEGLSESDQSLIKSYKPAYSWEPHPFAPYQLSNNNANIKNVQARIAQLEKTKAAPTKETEAGGVRVVDNAEDNRIQIFYPGKPDAATIAKLKQNGFKWAPSIGAWQRQRTGNARDAAKEITGIDLTKSLTEAAEKTAQTIDEFIDTSLPAGMSIRAAIEKKADDNLVIPGGELKSANDEVEERWQASKGITRKSLWERMKEHWATAKEQRKHFPGLDYKKDARTISILREFENVPEFSKKTAAEITGGLVAGMGPKKYDVFTRNIVLPDLIKDIDNGLYDDRDLPFGYKDKAEIQADLATFRKVAEANPDIQAALKRRAEFNAVLKSQLVENDLLPKEVLDDDAYFHHQVLMYIDAKNAAPGVSSKDVRTHKKGFQKGRTGSSRDFNTEYIESEFEYIAQAIAQLKTVETLKKVRTAADISLEVKRQAREQDLDNWRKAIPEGYTTWQPKPGTTFYKAVSIPEKIVDEIMSGKLAEVSKDDLQSIIAKGARNPEWVIPERLAKVLDDFRDIPSEGFDRFAKSIISSWKQWVLINPMRVLKYNINNMSGDLDIALAYDPRILRYFKQATSDAWAHYKGKAMTKDMREALEYGVIGSGISLHEIPDIKDIGVFRILAGKNSGIIERYWEKSKGLTSARENILRMAAYKYFKDQIGAGKKVYGASVPDLVDAERDPNRKAALLARDLIGDYGNISKAGQWLRDRMIPFFSWMEINAPRYVRLVRNLAKEEQSGTKAAARIGAVAASKAAKSTAKLAVKASALYGLVMLWNAVAVSMLGLSDDEERALYGDREQLHIILGRRDDGTIMTMRFQGALSDMLDWIGLGNVPAAVEDLATGKVTAGEQLKKSAKAPINRIVNASHPILKTAGEIITGKSIYPDIFKPRPIRDRSEHAARALTMDMPYRYITGKPTRGPEKDILSVLVYSNDPAEAAYWNTRKMVYEFLENQGKESYSYTPTKRSNAMYYYKQAKRFGDDKAAEKYMRKYLELGGTIKGFNRSLQMGAPTASLPRAYRDDFFESLNSEEQRDLEIAEKWYEQHMRATDEDWEMLDRMMEEMEK